MRGSDHFDAAALASFWDSLEESRSGSAAGPVAALISSAAPGHSAKNQQEELHRYQPEDLGQTGVTINKSAMILVRKTVLVALEMDRSARAVFLAQMREQYLENAKRADMSDAEALQWVEHLDKKIRKMIDAMEPGKVGGLEKP